MPELDPTLTDLVKLHVGAGHNPKSSTLPGGLAMFLGNLANERHDKELAPEILMAGQMAEAVDFLNQTVWNNIDPNRSVSAAYSDAVWHFWAITDQFAQYPDMMEPFFGDGRVTDSLFIHDEETMALASIRLWSKRASTDTALELLSFARESVPDEALMQDILIKQLIRIIETDWYTTQREVIYKPERYWKLIAGLGQRGIVEEKRQVALTEQLKIVRAKTLEALRARERKQW